MDETFAGIGYDESPERAGPLSPHAIRFFQQMRALVQSFGEDRAFFTSDCSKTGFSLWADGDVGDHAYANSLGNTLYRQEPVRYLAALGDKPWRPCAWHFRQMWKHQMALARQRRRRRVQRMARILGPARIAKQGTNQHHPRH